MLKTGTEVNGKPLYKKIGNERVHLSFANVSSAYPTPWTMWGGESPGRPIGNIKIGPAGLQCPEDNPVRTFLQKKSILSHLSEHLLQSQFKQEQTKFNDLRQRFTEDLQRFTK